MPPVSCGRSVVLVWVLAGATALAQPAAAPATTFEAQLRALAEIEALHTALLESTSATLTLEAWCRDHRLAAEPRILARLVAAPAQPPTTEQRRRLRVKPNEPVQHRRVQLVCGDRILSEADNWYVPARLTAEMRRLLQGTDTPFGKVVQPLKPTRRTFEARLLWSPLPDGWDRGLLMAPSASAAGSELPPDVLQHRAVLFMRRNLPFSEVDERYQRGVVSAAIAAPVP